MAAQWPLVVARLLELLPTLPGWSGVDVLDGPPVTAEVPTDYATVGYVADDNAGAYTTVQDPNGFLSVEDGTVRSQLSCVTGDVDLASTRIRAFALADALDAAVRADRTLGVLSPAGTSELVVDVITAQNGNGSGQSLIFTLHYQTVT
jgi:hypothetical protein